MADYKRKKVKKTFHHKNNHTQNYNVNTTNKKQKNTNVVPEENIRVVRGSKIKKIQQTKFWVTTVTVICLLCILFSAILPGGLYENILNYSSTLGHGTYPISISGNSVTNSVNNNSYYYVLSDTNLTIYSNGGKIIFDEMHGFANPILSVSETRALVYDQGGKNLYIYNTKGKIHTLTTEKEIITASISKNGDFAVSTHSDSYTSIVKVYNKKFKEIFTWNSAKDIVNNVLVNPNGNKLAVSTFNVVSGQYSSKVLILGFESADPLHTLDLGTSLALTLKNTGKGISVVCNDKYKFLHWSKYTSAEHVVSGEINLFRHSKNGVLLTVNRANDRSDNTVLILSNKGVKTSEFKINTAVTDIQYKKGRVYSLSDTNINIYDKNGNLLKSSSSTYGTKKISIINSNIIAAITDNEITKITVQEGEN